MTAMVGKLSKELIKSICMEASHYGICSPANYNTSNQIVISGEIPALEKAEELAKINGISKTIRLNVSGAFHSELMTDAYIEFLAELKKIKLNPMSLPFISNFNADVIYNDNDKLIHSLAGQLINPVLWEDSMHLLYSKGIDTLVEIGPGRTLSSFAKKINNNFKTYSLDKIDLNNIDLLLKDIKGGY
jgi:[acyl-carrier-protein] S-malonyltransferase